MERTVPWCYVVGTFQLIPATILFLPSFSSHYNLGVKMLISATSCLTFGALLKFYYAFLEAAETHKKTKRWAAYNTTTKKNRPFSESSKEKLLLESVIPNSLEEGLTLSIFRSRDSLVTESLCPLFQPFIMLLGGAMFLSGSIAYLPNFSSNPVPLFHHVSTLGTWLFRFGSMCYLTCSFVLIGDMWESGFYNRVGVGVISYVAGALLYLVGGVLSQLGLGGFAETWILGSVLFFLGSVMFVPVSEKKTASGDETLDLTNVTERLTEEEDGRLSVIKF
jgi:hypothetical protein